MDELMRRRQKFLINFAYFAVGFAIFYVCCRYLLYMVFPFVLAMVVTLCLRKPIMFVSRKFHIPKKGASVVILALFYIIIALILVGIIFGLISFSVRWIAELPEFYVSNVQPAIEKIINWFGNNRLQIVDKFSLDFSDLGQNLLDNLYSMVASASTSLLSFAQSFALTIPKILVGTVFSIIATVFMTVDWDMISHFILAQFDEKGQSIVRDVRAYLGKTVGHIVSSYALIMLITFVELSIGLSIFGVKNAVFYSALIAIFDIIPVFGVGGIVIPWAVIEAVNANWRMSVKLLIMWGIISVIRNYIEPRIVGKSVGLHPVLILLSMYAGVKLFGVFGLIIMPFSLIIIKKLNDSEKIHLFKSDYFKNEKEEIRNE